MSSDDDLLNYTPLQRSQVSVKQSKPESKSLGRRKKDVKAETKPRVSKPSKASTPVKNKFPVKSPKPRKSRADSPDFSSASDLARWNFLFRSEDKVLPKPHPVKRKNDLERESSDDEPVFLSQQKKVASGESVSQTTRTEQDDKNRCKHCKFPLTKNQNSRHVMLCELKDLSHLPNCSSGIECKTTTEEHFWKFSHNGKLSGISIDYFLTKGKTNGVTDMATKKDENNSFTKDIPGPSTATLTSTAAVSHELPDIDDISLENSQHYSQKSLPLFDLEQSENQNKHTGEKAAISEDSRESSILFGISSLQNTICEEDESTIYFESEKGVSTQHSYAKNQEQENQKSPMTDIQDDSKSESDLSPLRINEDEINGLSDSSGDKIIGNLIEETIDHFAMPALEKIKRWQKKCENVEIASGSAKSNSNNYESRSNKRAAQPLCIHLHYHEASSIQSPSKENGQTSILTYFKPTQSGETGCPCGDMKSVPQQKDILPWQNLKKKFMPLPSISQTSSEGTDYSMSRQSRNGFCNGGPKSGWKRKDVARSKNCPFYKYIPDTNIVVDAFNYGSVDGVTAYFLSHFHYDHYCGLRKGFNHPIYCSEITARLVNKKLGVSLQYINPLPMCEPQQVCGVEVTLLEANHCPGAVMFLFKVKPGVMHLHVGDFRAHPSMESYPALQYSIDTLFLDTTYCSPEHVFPTQEKVIEKCVSVALNHQQRNNKTLFVVGSYTIGKEKVFKSLASTLNCSIWVQECKKQILKCINDKEIQERLTNDKLNAKVHVLPMKDIKAQKLLDYLNKMRKSFNEIVGICPTGWEFTGGGLDDIESKHPYADVYIYGIPYSEHSSFNELRRFVQFLKPKKIIPTVNNGKQSTRKQMEQYFNEWQST